MTEPYYADDLVTLHLGDCLEVLRTMESDSIDAIVTDPPAGIAFMDREWDDFRRARNPADTGRDNVFGRTSARGPEYGRGDRRAFVNMLTERMAEAYRVLKPGGHALVWSIPRTSHWTAWALEDAGFDIRDCILHLFGSGFPKSLDVARAIDKAADYRLQAEVRRAAVAAVEQAGLTLPGNSRWDWTAGEHAPGDKWWAEFLCWLPSLADVDRERVEGAIVATVSKRAGWFTRRDVYDITAPATEDAARWAGWGTALKPGQEMWWLVRKALAGTVAANVLLHGTGALNIATCRVAHASEADLATSQAKNPGRADTVTSGVYGASRPQQSVNDAGRWPANIVLTHSASCEPIGTRLVKGITGGTGNHDGGVYGARSNAGAPVRDYAGADGLEAVEAWRCADDCPVAELDRQSAGTRASKPSKTGNAGNAAGEGVYGGGSGLPRDYVAISRDDTGGASRFYPTFRYQAKAPASERPRLEDGTAHETVKSLGLMSWLVKLITPPGGTVLDMFAGSGPVGEVCVINGFRCVLIEKDPKSAELIKARLSKPIQPDLFGGAALWPRSASLPVSSSPS